MAKNQTNSGDKLLMRGFGDRLKSLRKAYAAAADEGGPSEHTKTKWAARLSVSPAMYGRWEAGKNMPMSIDLLRISLLFRVDPNYLIAGVLSGGLAYWLYTALLADNQKLETEADYWKRQYGSFERASRALLDAEALDEKVARERLVKEAVSKLSSSVPPGRVRGGRKLRSPTPSRP